MGKTPWSGHKHLEVDPQKTPVRGPVSVLFNHDYSEQTQRACCMARGILVSLKYYTPTNHYYQDPNSSEGRSIARVMTSTPMMAVVGFLEKIVASKAAADKRTKDQKEYLNKVCAIVCSYTIESKGSKFLESQRKS